MTQFPPPCWSEYQRHRNAIADAIDERKWPIDWLDGEILNGTATVMADDKACIVVALRRYPGGLIDIHGLVAAGELSAIIELIREAETWGASHGAQVASVASRRGWIRALSGCGYRETQVSLEKDLS